jgi:hypothetical protein
LKLTWCVEHILNQWVQFLKEAKASSSMDDAINYNQSGTKLGVNFPSRLIILTPRWPDLRRGTSHWSLTLLTVGEDWIEYFFMS